ncbi:MAG: EAL domain-containing protein [Gammaproteobacteria bacterium]|nr:EAL domain-containing protein [Gammaproteobacteria bacterium]MBU1601766.1 EAL domain-containing protein [Gammaproteobacteria bacterium]MBU2432138.1 EAL domain-containing protein [Gammaproteobacteria bacterium]MBU2450469.1 EAL domain-containing protein [Gammaproteobacteria bacterium]
MAWLSGWLLRFKRTTFRRQLAILFGAGVLGVSLLAAFATSWQGSRQLYSSKLDDGLRITQTLATQSRLALAFGSTDNVAEALETAAAFPDVTRIEIRHTDGRVLFESGNVIVGEVATNLPNSSRRPYLLAENAAGWRFVAPVWSLSGPDSQFEVTEGKDILLGFVIIDQSKATLKALVREVFVVNFTAGLAFALIFGIGLRFLARRLIRPLANLSATMARAEKGEGGLRADISGPQDLAEMAHAFNSMMVALEQREQELRTARDSALRFAKLKSDFAATVSHEIRTPLNGVIGTLDMLKLGKLDHEQHELLGLAWDSSQYLLELINNILDFSRLEAGRMAIDACDFALQPLVDGVFGMFQTQAAGKGLELAAILAPTVPKILNGDPARIRQILINLIGNAVKFTEQGSVTLTVETAENGEVLQFGVRDTGIGIAEEHQSVIFDSFTQADTSTTRRYGGSGLGLSICKQVVHLLGGEIGVEGRPGQGSLFWFTIPCITGRPIASLRPEAEAPALSGLRILIAEDNVTNQLVAAGMLRLIGCSSAIARNGKEAVSMWQDGDWDLILMDCSMPEMDGFQATAAIRQLEAGRGKHIPIFAMTANTLPADIERCKASGMDDHLPKPLTLNTLTTRLEHWLNWQPGKALIPQTAVDTSSQSLDCGVVTRLRDILGSSIGEAVRPFLEDMPGYLSELETAIADGNAATLHQVTHVIKGAASNLGAIALAGVAREMELRAEASDFSETNELLQRLRTEFALVEPILTAELEGTSSSQPLLREDAPVVLVVDDDRSTRSALRNALQRSGFRVAEAGDGNDALIWLENNDADAVLMDALMPVMDGFDACLALKRHPRWKEIPILMITALDDRQSIERAFEVGASDFIPKPIHLSVVNQRVRRVIDATRAERHVQHLAYNDALTGLPNRLLFMEQLSRAIEHAAAHTTQLAVLFLDLDRFKFINDTLGHEAGDKLLATMAQRLKGCVRADDCVARLGGDEFTVLLDDLPNAAVAASVAQNICRTVSAPLIIDGQEIVITTSIGISLFPQDGPDLSRLLRHADTAMYRAKQSGSGFCYYEAAMESAVSDRLKLENDLRHALEREEFSVFYQPVIDTISGSITSVEALVRWIHPENGIVSPAEFIPVAEETGLILPLGEFVLRSACRQTKAWLDNGMPNLHVAVNLSAKQLEQPNLRNIILGALEDSGLPASSLVLEITESVLMERAAESIGLLRELRNLGIHISIDDFGTGYSSLSYLKHLPANTLKIDRSFVQDMPEDEDAVAIVTGILALAHSLRMTVVAEGVETDAQRATLTRLECDCMQGFLFSKPLPAELVETRLFAPKRRKRALKKQS